MNSVDFRTGSPNSWQPTSTECAPDPALDSVTITKTVRTEIKQSDSLESNESTAPAATLPVTVIEPRRGWQLINVSEIWRARELLYILTWRDIKVRYKQTVLGIAWAVLQPIAMMAVCSVMFRRLADSNASAIPYPLFVFAGFLPWFLFSNTITAAAQSVVGNQSLVTKVYFPRLVIPIAAAGPCLLDLIVGLVLLCVMAIVYGIPISWQLLLLPIVIGGLMIAAMGIGTLLAALTVAYRDFRYVVPFMVQLWMFATPSIYLQADVAIGPLGLALLPFNPAYGLIVNFRAAAFGGELDFYSFTISTLVAVAGLLLGCFYFRRMERGFADTI